MGFAPIENIDPALLSPYLVNLQPGEKNQNQIIIIKRQVSSGADLHTAGGRQRVAATVNTAATTATVKAGGEGGVKLQAFIATRCYSLQMCVCVCVCVCVW